MERSTGGGGRRPTLRDVAAMAGVSMKTVSRVVNAEGNVSDAMSARVEDAIGRTGYRPDLRARMLRRTGSRTATVGFVQVDVSNPFFSALFRGIEDEATERDSQVLAGSTDRSTDREERLIDSLLERRVDGLLVVTSAEDPSYIAAQMVDLPVVFIDIEPALDDIDVVRTDHYFGAHTATTHLVSHGHRHLAYLGDDPAIWSAQQRAAGFLDAAATAGIEVPDEWILTGPESTDGWYRRVRELLTRPDRPTAVFTAQNFVTMGAVRAIHELGLAEEVAMVGFDDIELASVLRPGITVYPQHPRQLGREAAGLLFDRVAGSDGPARRVLHRSDLIERGSGELPPPHVR